MTGVADKISKAIGYTFKDTALLTLALSHRSVGKENNERLEFLGDSIVNLIVALALFQKEFEASEGDLSRMRASLVKGETLAAVAKDFNLGEYLKLGPGEIKSGGHKRSSILAGALEALIGALYLDAGFDVCQAVVLKWFEERLLNTTVEQVEKDPKTALQECLQARKLPLPEYNLISATGAAHKQVFLVECYIEALKKSIKEEGMSRRKAEQNAAEKMLKDIERDA